MIEAKNETNKELSYTDRLISSADKKLEELLEAGDFTTIYNAIKNLGEYSIRNEMLILSQFPEAAFVSGMSSWNYRRRSVMPNSKAIKILAPEFAREVSIGADQKVSDTVSDRVIGYQVHNVFDISQTSAKEGAQLYDVRVHCPDLETEYETVVNALQKTLDSYHFIFTDLEKGQNAVLSSDEKTIKIREGLSRTDTIRTMINQIAAAKVLMRDRRKINCVTPKQAADIYGNEISAITYIVANRLGVATDHYQVPEIRKEDFTRFAANLGVIRSVSQNMIMTVENAVSFQRKTQVAESCKNMKKKKAVLE